MFGRRPKSEPLTDREVRVLRSMQGFCRRHGLTSVEVHDGPLMMGTTFTYLDGLGWTRRRYGASTADAEVLHHPELPEPDPLPASGREAAR